MRTTAEARLLPRPCLWGLADTIPTGLEGRGITVYYFGRRHRDRGPVYYFPAVLAAKMPVGLLVLALAGLVLLATRRLPRSWRLPGLALVLLAALFLLALARGASYGGIRHALPVLVVLAVFGGMALALATGSGSRAAQALVAAAVIAAVISAVPRIHPWEYFNELVGGPEGAYLRLHPAPLSRPSVSC